VLDAYLEEGLFDAEGGVALKTSGFQEGVTFNERRRIFETWEQIKDLDERIPLRWMMSGKPGHAVVTGGENATANTVWRRPKNSSNMRFLNSGHMIIQEIPQEFATDLCAFLISKYGAASQAKL